MHITIDLPDDIARYLEEETKAGPYDSTGQVVSEALKLLASFRGPPVVYEGEELQRLRRAWQEGIASGDAGEIDFEELKREARRRRAERT